ncbi:MAG: DivIVA domain-containing protein [Blautia sp.]|nr:DivIVA domain-containing protein [Blautia sp.]
MAYGKLSKPVFTTAVRGYNKADVDDYLLRNRSEMELILIQQTSLENRVREEQEKVRKMKALLENLQQEKASLSEKNTFLKKRIKALENENLMLKEDIEEAGQSGGDKTQLDWISEMDKNPDVVMEVVLSAQQKRKSILEDAVKKAADIVDRADAHCQEREAESDRLLEDARNMARNMIQQAQTKRDMLLVEYEDLQLMMREFKEEALEKIKEQQIILDGLFED